MLNNQYVKWGLTAFCTIGALALFHDTMLGSRTLITLFSRLVQAMQPVLYGAAMAYLLAPVINFFDEAVGGLAKKPGIKGRKVSLGVRAVSILLTWVLVLIMLYLIGLVLLPELYRSIVQLIGSIETYYNTILGWMHRLLEINPTLESWVMARMDTYYAGLETWFTRDLLPQATGMLTAISGSLFSFLGVLGDLLVGAIVSVYFLASKESCAAWCRRLVSSLFPDKQVYWILRGVQKMDVVFAGFVRGKLLDSLIIGILCFFGCTLLKMPYTPLVSVVVGVTNVIPFFGPFMGAIPSAFLILLVSPKQCLIFVIFVVVLQQFDGNILGPKILGDATGISSFWVIVAILVGGGFGGVLGMFIGVPVFACVQELVKYLTDRRLRRRNMPTGAYAYVGRAKDEPTPDENLDQGDAK